MQHQNLSPKIGFSYLQTPFNELRRQTCQKPTLTERVLCLQGMEVIFRVGFSILSQSHEYLMSLDMEGMLKVSKTSSSYVEYTLITYLIKNFSRINIFEYDSIIYEH